MRNILCILLFVSSLKAQVSQFPYVQNFDSVTPPALPTGWTTTTNRSLSGDFKTISTTVRSMPNAVVDSNSTISQSLISPTLNFSNRIVDSLEFWERRTAAHNSGVLIEASTDGGVTFALQIGDTLVHPGVTTYVRRAIAFPPSLNNQANVNLRWRVVGNGSGGTTSTLRFDDVRIAVKIQFDAGIGRIQFFPQFPVVGDSVVINATVKNYGIQPIVNVLVEFYDDRNRDSLPQPGELFDSVRISSALAPGDSAVVPSLLSDLLLGEKYIIVQTRLADDEVPANDGKTALLTIGVVPFSVVVNEVMYGPGSPEPEWVEIINATNDVVNLRLWKISDRSTALQAIITNSDFYLMPDQFAVLAKDSASLVAVQPAIPVRVFHVPGLAVLNNDSDAVVLFDHRGAKVDSLHYRSSWGGTLGRSLERKDARGPSLAQSNWGSSLHPSRSTPGRKNSLTPKDFDVTVSRISFTPSDPYAGDDVHIAAIVRNNGRFSTQNIMVEFYEDVNRDSLPQAEELLAIQPVLEIAAGDSAFIAVQRSALQFGEHVFIVRSVYSQDEDTTNNIRKASLAVGYLPNTVVINEIMYAPSGEPEWVELLNIAADSVSIKDWKVSNRNSTTRYVITSADVFLRRDQHVVVTKDTALLYAKHTNVQPPVVQASSLPTFLFNNSGDAVVVFDTRGVVMDSVLYLPTWGGTGGKSLERGEPTRSSHDSTNWGSSLDSLGGTPGRHNTRTPVEFDLRPARVGMTVEFPSLNIRVVVVNVGREPASGYAIALFHDANGDSTAQVGEFLDRRVVFSVLQPRDSVAVDFVWREAGFGRKDLIIVVEYPNDLRPSNNTAHSSARINYPEQSVVLNEVMYAPLSGQTEYVELYNRSELTIDLRDWKISDMRDVSGKANEVDIEKRPYLIEPGDYAVVASDSSIFRHFHLDVDSANGIHVFILNRNAMSLNNEGDDVILRDLTGTVIDSLRYVPDWHNAHVADATGRALERINPELPSTDRRNWSTSAHYLGGTPGKRNSIFTPSVPSSASLSFFPNPFSPDGDGHEDFTQISYGVPSRAALLRIRIFDAKGRLMRTLINGEPTGARGSVVWDGMNDSRDKVRMGIYVVLLEALDAGGATIHSVKAAVVVAAKL